MLIEPSKKSLKEIFSSSISFSSVLDLMTLDITRPFTSSQEKLKESSDQLEIFLERGRFLEDFFIAKGILTHEKWEELIHEIATTHTPLATLLVKHRIVPPELIGELAEELKREIEERSERGPSVRRILLEEKILTEEQIEQIKENSREEGIIFTQAAVESGLVPFEKMSSIYKKHLHIDSIDIKDLSIEFQVVHLVPDNLMKTHELLPFKRKGKKLHLAMSDPRNRVAIKKIEMMTQLEAIPHLAKRKDLLTRLDEFIIVPSVVQNRLNALKGDDNGFMDLLESDSAVKMVNKILEGAFNTHATDIHVEPCEKGLRIRYRLDGLLYDIMNIPRDMGIPTVSRMKVLAGMDLTERRRPQDGHISHMHEGRRYDLRVATLPTNIGEKVVLRIHDETAVIKGLSYLGMEPENLSAFKELIHRPHGMILVTGPIGSGKSTTLYTAISEVNHQTKNIVTLEDPVEYQLPGINQVQVDSKIGISFASGLRSILRQDANVLLVGEIRDNETASTAVRAANTGHLLFSTLHTNNSISAITALEHLGVARYHIATSLVAVVAQRLLRILCPHCKKEVEPTPTMKALCAISDDRTLWQSVGCPQCFGVGYLGRTGIFELFSISDSIQDALLGNVDEKTLTRQALQSGMVTLQEAGRRKLLEGLTDFKELSRVVMLQPENSAASAD